MRITTRPTPDPLRFGGIGPIRPAMTNHGLAQGGATPARSGAGHPHWARRVHPRQTGRAHPRQTGRAHPRRTRQGAPPRRTRQGTPAGPALVWRAFSAGLAGLLRVGPAGPTPMVVRRLGREKLVEEGKNSVPPAQEVDSEVVDIAARRREGDLVDDGGSWTRGWHSRVGVLGRTQSTPTRGTPLNRWRFHRLEGNFPSTDGTPIG
ncbi:hypothetical protein Taro_006337 [Colocasia esculenta]|uniref:Uncharacterized protein n=1 Tax=Colocasia esculenta TaxID=4460 RepID=A0A843TV03_COLES|nr:hypothetical protein [Colocasia esculenta]